MSSSTTQLSLGMKFTLVIIALGAIGVVAEGVFSRQAQSQEVENWTAQRQLPTVALVSPVIESTEKVLQLPARLEAQQAAALFARVDGYVSQWHVDIGARVKKGDVLVELATPDIDQQLLQAKAELARAKAAVELTRSTLTRWQGLANTKAVSEQDLDVRLSEYKTAQADVALAEATVQGWLVQKQLATVTAPFAGVITARNIDIGDLVDAGNSEQLPMFRLASIEALRVNIDVPQKYVPQVNLTSTATLKVPEYPATEFSVVAQRSSYAIDRESGTARIELRLDNQDEILMPGSYAQITLALSSATPIVTIPASALIFNAQGLTVATVDDNNQIILKLVVLARDLGRTVEIVEGLTKSDRVVANPPDGIAANDTVNVIEGA